MTFKTLYNLKKMSQLELREMYNLTKLSVVTSRQLLNGYNSVKYAKSLLEALYYPLIIIISQMI